MDNLCIFQRHAEVPTRLEGMETSQPPHVMEGSQVPTRLEGMETNDGQCKMLELVMVPTRLEGMETGRGDISGREKASSDPT